MFGPVGHPDQMPGRNEAGGVLVARILESTLESVDIAEQLAREAAQAAGLDEDGQYELAMAVRESVINAVVHGNCYSRKKKVRLNIRQEPDRLVVSVADEGKGFDPSKVPDPLAPENLLNQSGRGLLLIRAFTDEVSVRTLQPQGTEFVLVKYLKRPGSRAAEAESQPSGNVQGP